jgi:hypothetical protein
VLTPSFWTRVHVSLAQPFKAAEWLKLSIQRAKDSPMHLCFHLNFGNGALHVQEVYIDALHDMLHAASLHPSQFVEFSVHYEERSVPFVTSMMSAILAQKATDFYKLRTIEVFYRGSSHFEQPVITVYPGSIICMARPHVGDSPFHLRIQGVKVSSSVKGITSLDLGVVDSHDPFLVKLATECPRLERLVIRKLPSYTRDAGGPLAHFPALRHLAVRNGGLSRCDFDFEEYAQSLSHFVIPNVETLELEGKHLREIMDGINQSRPLLKLKKLRLGSFKLQKGSFIRDGWSMAFPNLEEIHFVKTVCIAVWPLDERESEYSVLRSLEPALATGSLQTLQHSVVCRWPRLSKITLITQDGQDLR